MAVAVIVRLPTLAFPIVEAHSWRQTHTAFPAVIWAKEGLDLLNPQVPVLGPPWVEGAAIVRAATNEGEYVDLGCASWNTEVMFCAERKGFAAFGDGSCTRFDDPRVCVDESVVWGVSPG
jgi:hypothetical protein